MDLKKLEYFLTVAREGQITKAAQVLYMSQPPLSYQLKAFEQELGVRLLERDGRNIKLTDCGRFLYERGPQILELVAKTVAELQQFTQSTPVILTIGNATPWGYTVLSDQVRSFTNNHPHVNFRLWEGDTYHVMDLLNSGVIEIGFVTIPVNAALYEAKLLDIEAFVAFFSEKYNYGQYEQYVTLNELASAPTILIHHHMYDLLSTYYKCVGLQPKLLCHNNLTSMLDWAANEPWVVIGPKSIFDFSPRANVKYKQIADPPLEVNSYIVWRKEVELSKVARAFIDMILTNFEVITNRSSNTELFKIIGQPDRYKKVEISRCGNGTFPQKLLR